MKNQIKMEKSKWLLLAFLLFCMGNLCAQDWQARKQVLFGTSNGSVPYRIPAIATTHDGHVVAISDYRPGGGDVGQGEVDMHMRRSTAAGTAWNGSSWTDEKKIADGDGGSGFNAAFGDAALVADRESGDMLIMCAAGSTFYGTATGWSDYFTARLVSTDNGATWSSPEECKTSFVGSSNIFNKEASAAFFASGRLVQSRTVKVGSHYRIYGALLVKHGGLIGASHYNYVAYSDDFGETWKLLGGGPACTEDTNEPKVEELPNGDILLSARRAGGRNFNVFHFTNAEKAEGRWDEAVASNSVGGLSFGGNSSNGEIMLYEGATNVYGESVTLLFQSVPTGDERSNVSIYYKEIENKTYTPTEMAKGWQQGIEVDNGYSCYSTMTILPDTRIGFFYEGNGNSNEPKGYDMTFLPLNISEITGGVYWGPKEEIGGGEEVDEALLEQARQLVAYRGVGYPAYDAECRINLEKQIEHPTSDAVLEAAIASFINETEELEWPVTGGNYRFVNVMKDGERRYFQLTPSGLQLTTEETEATAYVCTRLDNGKFNFQASDDSYLIWKGLSGTERYPYFWSPSRTYGYNGNLGYLPATSYDEKYCELTLSKLVPGGYVTGENADLLGMIAVQGWRYSRDQAVYFVLKELGGSDAGFDAGESPYYNDTHSSAFFLEEVGSEVTAKPAEIDGKEWQLATFSAPYATVVPQGVTAYIAAAAAGGKVWLRPAVRAGQVIPDHAGVILIAEKEASFEMEPAADGEEAVELEGNLLGHSADGPKVMLAEEHPYILTNGSNGFGFYRATPGSVLPARKAYLRGAELQDCMTMTFDEPTGISEVQPEHADGGPVYDLSGRRVSEPLRPGIYIRNGRKFIVK